MQILMALLIFVVAADYCKIDSGVLQHLCICLSFISIVSQAFFLSVGFVLSEKKILITLILAFFSYRGAKKDTLQLLPSLDLKYNSTSFLGSGISGL